MSLYHAEEAISDIMLAARKNITPHKLIDKIVRMDFLRFLEKPIFARYTGVICRFANTDIN